MKGERLRERRGSDSKIYIPKPKNLSGQQSCIAGLAPPCTRTSNQGVVGSSPTGRNECKSAVGRKRSSGSSIHKLPTS